MRLLTHAIRPLFAALVGLVVGAGSGCFLLDRASQLEPGTIRGVVHNNAGDTVAGASVELIGLGRRARTDDDGAFILRGIPVGGHAIFATIDVDGDTVADEGAVRTVLVPLDSRTRAVVGVDLGRVDLLPTGTIEGKAVDDAGAPIGDATLALWRSVTLSQDGTAPLVIDLAVERLVQSAADGGFRIPGLIVGDVLLSGFDSVAGIATRGSVPQTVTVLAGETAKVDDTALDPVEGTRKARISFVGQIDEEIEIRITPTGTPPDEVTATVANSNDVVIDVPFGIWDVYLRAGVRNGVLLRQVAPPPGPEIVSWGIAELVAGDDVCGDGIISGDEACDSGEANSDSVVNACRTTCVLPSCGDGVTDSGEACDTGDDISATEPNACRPGCVLPSCGDGVPDDDEECDSGDGNSDTEADACRTTCVLPSCGDGVPDDGEGCDTGDAISATEPDACRPGCVEATCGDGVQDSDEGCDAGDAAAETSLWASSPAPSVHPPARQ